VSFAAERELVDFRACFLLTGQLGVTSLGAPFLLFGSFQPKVV